MLVVDVNKCPEFIAGDETTLREVLHPGRAGAAIPYSLAHAALSPGRRSLSHRLRGSEVYYILRGRGRIHVGGESSEVHEGNVVYVPPGATQFIENTGGEELAFLCIVDPAWRAEDEEVEAEADEGPQDQEGLS